MWSIVDILPNPICLYIVNFYPQMIYSIPSCYVLFMEGNNEGTANILGLGCLEISHVCLL
jgi:hypothetical protein